MQRASTPPYAPVNDLNAIALITKGGTGVGTIEEAVDALGAISINELGTAGVLAAYNAQSEFDESIIPNQNATGACLKGDKTVGLGTVNSYTITNYDSSKTYNVSVSAGSVYISGNVIAFTAPDSISNVTLTVNDRSLTISVVNHFPVTPVLAASTSGNATSASLVLNGSNFSMTGGSNTHQNTDWDVSNDEAFANIVYGSDNDATNKTGLTVNNLAFNTKYYARCRYRDNQNNVTNWSNVVTITTLSDYLPSAEEAKLTATDKATNAWFGSTISISTDGSRVAIGSYNMSVSGLSAAGAAYIFVRNGSSWTQETKLIAPDRAASDQFAWSIDLDDNGVRVVIGTKDSDPGAVSSAGAAYIFVRNTDFNTWSFEAKLVASDRTSNDNFGQSSCIDATGTRVAIGAHRSEAGISEAGTVYVFLRTDTSWSEEAKLNASDKANTDWFGWSVDCDKDATRIIVGAQVDDSPASNAGSAYVFVRSGTVWTQEARLVASNQVSEDRFGYAVSINDFGTVIAVSASQADPDAITTAGCAYLFRRTGTTWNQVYIFTASNKASNDQYGQSISLDATGNKLAIGSFLSQPGGTGDAGSVYLYVRDPVADVWTEQSILFSSDKAPSDQFGFSCALARTSSRLAVGAHQSDPSAITSAGSVYIYS